MIDIIKDYTQDRKNSELTKWKNLEAEFGDKDLLPLWIADMDFSPSREIAKALADYANNGHYGYFFPIPGSYYQAIIDWTARHFNYPTEAAWYRNTPGICTGLAMVLQAFTAEGDKILIHNPVYNPFRTVTLEAGREIVMQDLAGNEEAGYHIDFDDMEEVIKTKDITAYILCSPHNPIGRVWTKEELTKIIDLCKKYDVLLISDEAHRDLVWDGHQHIPSAAVDSEFNKIITFSSGAKPFALAGFNHAYMMIPSEQLRKQWDDYSKTIHLGDGSAGGYIALETAYNEGQEWLDAVTDIIWHNYKYLKSALAEKLPEIKVADLQATYLAWIDLGAYIAAADLKDIVQNKAKLAVNYGSTYWPTRKDDTHIRINLATTPAIIEEAVDNLVAAVKAYQN